jgi:hypothetical protein
MDRRVGAASAGGSGSPNLVSPVAALRTIASAILARRRGRSQWRRCARPDRTGSAIRRSCGFDGPKRAGRPRARLLVVVQGGSHPLGRAACRKHAQREPTHASGARRPRAGATPLRSARSPSVPFSASSVASTTELALILGSCLSNTAFAFGVDERLDAAAGVGKHDAQRLLDQHDTTVRTAELDNALVLREMRTVFAVRSASGSGQLSASRRRGAGCTSCRLAAPESQPLHRRREDVAPGDLRVLAL